MPMRAPRICGCGHRIASGAACPCEAKRNSQRKAKNDQQRPSARARGYDTKWDKERKAFLELHPRCAKCSAPATVVDHIIAHGGDQKLFWSRSNWQPLCTTHHNRSKQAQEKRIGGWSKTFKNAPGPALLPPRGIFPN
jgi:5-methylcytosine-specific restriction endonuclease McrA